MSDMIQSNMSHMTGVLKKITGYYNNFIWLLYGAIHSKIDQAVQDLSQNEIFDL